MGARQVCMCYIEINGSEENPININYSSYPQGSKNAGLPLLCASLLFDNEVQLDNIPDIEDINIMLKLFSEMGIEYNFSSNSFSKNKVISSNDVIEFSSNFNGIRCGYYLVGAIVNKCSKVIINTIEDGGCRIGERNCNKFLEVLYHFGFQSRIENEKIIIEKVRDYKSSILELNDLGIVASGISLILASQYPTKTTIKGFGKSPELYDLIEYLSLCGVEIDRQGWDIYVTGISDNDKAVEFKLQDDRIVIATYVILCLVNKGSFKIKTHKLRYLHTFIELIEKIGYKVFKDELFTVIEYSENLSAVSVKVEDYPGISTDIQPILSVLLCTINGQSHIQDKIFPSRISHINNLLNLNQNIELERDIKIIGRNKFIPNGEHLIGKDLRCSAATIIACSGAKGKAIMHDWKHLLRGYEHLIDILNSNRALYCYE